jgi:hypothetical protein
MPKIRVAVAVVSVLTFTAHIAAADDPASPQQPDPPAPAPAPYQPPGGAPAVAPPGNSPPSNGPPGNTQQLPGALIYAPEEITEFDNNAPVPYGYTKVVRARKGLIIGGGVTLGAAYLTTVLTGALAAALGTLTGSRMDAGPAFVPVLGPFLEMGQDHSGGQRAWAALGLAQTAGAIMLVYGLNNRRTILVRNDQLSATSIAPLIAPGASGLSVVGRF